MQCSKYINETAPYCSNCKVTFYCSKKCQQESWKQGGHREVCKMLAKYVAGLLHLSTLHYFSLADQQPINL